MGFEWQLGCNAAADRRNPSFRQHAVCKFLPDGYEKSKIGLDKSLEEGNGNQLFELQTVADTGSIFQNI
jgi:hypothetical protein